jgi:hypothetical protein
MASMATDEPVLISRAGAATRIEMAAKHHDFILLVVPVSRRR